MTRALACLILTSLLCHPAPLQSQENRDRRLSFYNTHTRERLTVCYRRGEVYLPEGLKKINHILRDHRADETHSIDPELLDYLYDLQRNVGNGGEIHVISGYRSPSTNAKLRRRSRAVAAKSLHMQGKALDFRLPGTDTSLLRDRARRMRRGGVGYYGKSDFIQIDTGRVRFW